MLCCCCCCCWQCAVHSAGSAESEALHSAEHYGPLKTRLYHRAKHYGPLKARLKDHGNISNFCTFLLYLDYELLLRSLRSLRSKYLIFRPWFTHVRDSNSKIRTLKLETRIQKSQIALPENLKSTILKSEIKSLIFEMPLVISTSPGNHGLSQFVMSFRISNQ